MLKFIAPLIVVQDIARSRTFYEKVLGQTVKFDFGENVQFEGDFSIHLQPHYQMLLGGGEKYTVTKKAHWGELYFETDELENIQQRLTAADVEFIHPVREQPWGEHVMRFYDPDGHIVEIGEPLESVARRFHREGKPVDWIMEKVGMPRDFVEHALSQK